MQMKEIIRAKRDGHELTREQIEFWVKGVTDGSIPDYQSSAMLMAIFFNKMNIEERSFYTRAIAQSGENMNFSHLNSYIIDKHSTGGIGDKTSLILGPLMAALGIKNPMISGRGLGFTGGTLDKLASIPGYSTVLSWQEMSAAIEGTGVFIAGQTGKIAPADKKLYALRDVTETVEEISLITGSILGKKLTEGLNGLVLDVKCGTGAFMKNIDEARTLAHSLVKTAQAAGVGCTAVLTEMNAPLGEYTGNMCEVYEALEFMKPGSPYFEIFTDKIEVNESAEYCLSFSESETSKDDLVFITIALAVEMIKMALKIDASMSLQKITEVWQSGLLLKKFEEMIKKQGGDVNTFRRNSSEVINKITSNQKINQVFEYLAPESGYLHRVNGEAIGNLMVSLEAGRKTAEDIINHDVSLQWLGVENRYYQKGELLARIYIENTDKFNRSEIEKKLDSAISIEKDAPVVPKKVWVLETVE